MYTRQNNKTVKLTKHHSLSAGQPLIEILRNNMRESLHSGHLLILDNNGKIKLSLGNHNFLIYTRSAIKAIQTSAMVRCGLNISDELLALVSSSHIGSPLHLGIRKSRRIIFKKYAFSADDGL